MVGRGSGWVYLQGASSIVVSGLSYRRALVGIGWPISILFGVNGLGTSRLTPFPAFRAQGT